LPILAREAARRAAAGSDCEITVIGFPKASTRKNAAALRYSVAAVQSLRHFRLAEEGTRMSLRLPCALLFGAVLLVFPHVARAQSPSVARVDRYGDPLPRGAIARLGTSRFQHAAWTFAIAFSPDSTIVATAGSGIRLWEGATGKLIRHIDHPADHSARSLEFTSDGTTLVVDSLFGDAIFLYDVAGNKKMRRLGPEHGYPPGYRMTTFERRVAVLPGTDAFAGYRQSKQSLDLSIWDVKSLKPVDHKPPDGHKTSYAFIACAPDGRTLATTDTTGSQLILWDRFTGKVLHVLHQAGYRSYARFSPDGGILASNGDGDVVLWDLATGKVLGRIEDTRIWASDVVLHPDGQTLLLAGKQCVGQWEITSGKRRRQFCMPGGQITGLALSPDGRRVAAVDEDGAVHVWETATGREVFSTEGHRRALLSFAFTPDSRHLISAASDGVRVWDIRTTKVVSSFARDTEFTSLAFLPDGKTLLAGGEGHPPQLWDPAGGRVIREFSGPKESARLRLSRDGKLAASVAGSPTRQDPQILLWEVQSGEVTARTGPSGFGESGHRRARFAEFAPDGACLAVGSTDGMLELWTLREGKAADLMNPEEMYGAVFSPDGRLLVVACWNCIRFFETGTGKVIGEYGRPGKPPARTPPWMCFQPHYGPLAFSPDGRTIAIRETDGTVRLCETATRQQRRKLDGHGWHLAFSPDGKALATGQDTTIVVWDVFARLSKERPMASAWAGLAGADAQVAYGAACQMIAMPAQTLPFLEARMAPVPSVSPVTIAHLIANLDSDDFADRTAAARTLEALGDVAEPALARAVKGRPTLEFRRRAEQLLADMEAKRHNPCGERLRQLRAIEILEHIATPDARRLLEELATGAADACLTREARAALGRLKEAYP
jgi:WD40 repeat protein